jgi:hypothetical protein
MKKSKTTASEDAIEVLANRMTSDLSVLFRTACPQCEQHTLTVEVVRGSGIQFFCQGLARHSTDQESTICDYSKIFLVTAENELPALVVAAEVA